MDELSSVQEIILSEDFRCSTCSVIQPWIKVGMRVSEPCDGYEKKLFSLDLAYRLGNVILSGETGLVVLQSPLRLTETEGFSCY